MTRIFRLLAVFVSTAALAACDPPIPPADTPAPAPAAQPGDLAAARAKWRASGPASYAYTYGVSCFCLNRGEFAVEVRDGRVASVRRADGSAQEGEMPEVLTVDRLFDRIAEAAGQGTPTRVVYDAALGFPAEAEIGTIANDAGTVYTIRGLRPL